MGKKFKLLGQVAGERIRGRSGHEIQHGRRDNHRRQLHRRHVRSWGRLAGGERQRLVSGSRIGGQGDRDDLLVIARDDVLVGVGRVRPVDLATGAPLAGGTRRGDQLRAADLGKFLR